MRRGSRGTPSVRTLDVRITGLDADGDGLARVGGSDIAVPFTIPGERVRVRVRARPGVRTRGRVVEMLDASPHRVVASCRHFGQAEAGHGGCGGCSWQHIAYEEQLRLKTGLLERLVRQRVPAAPAVRPMLPATPVNHPWGFRNRVHFVFDTPAARPRSAALVMGHYARGSQRVVPIEDCPVHDARGNALAFAFRDACREAGARGMGGVSTGTLRGVAVRASRGTDETGLTLVVTRDGDARVRTATRRVMAAAAPTAVHVNLHPTPDSLVFGPVTRRIAGPARIRETVLGASYAISPTAFFQTNVAAAEILVRLVVDAVPTHASVLDLYAGAGLFALPLARGGRRVVAVESNRDAVADGRASLALNGIDESRCRFIARPVEAALASLPAADAVVLDPPREGCARAVIEQVFGRLRPPTAVYVSCNPETLARDLAAAAAAGYGVRSIQPVDMFPHTPHVESVTVLGR